jgi:diguanylate cyclase (GGDEF)-like protein
VDGTYVDDARVPGADAPVEGAPSLPDERVTPLAALVRTLGRDTSLPRDAPEEAHALLADLRADRLRVHYQPIVALPARRLLGFEALARIENPDGSLRPPARFVPLAEAYGLTSLLGVAVLVEAVRSLDRWRRLPWGAHLRVSVNVAAGQLADPEFVGHVQHVLDDVDVPAASLLLELTEGAALRADAPEVRSTLDRMAALGVGWALDDFGTGFATLDNVKHLPVRVLKLDRGFIAGIEDGRQEDEAIVRAVIGLADSLGLLVVAEGVETERQARLLSLWGCSSAQGYLFGRPEPGAEADRTVAATRDAAPVTPMSSSWTSQSRATAIGLARVLAALDRDGGRRRALVATVASALARQLGLAPRDVDDVVSLALVHDATSLRAGDAGGEGERLRDEVPALGALILPPAEDEPLECQLVRAALATVAAVGSDAGGRTGPTPPWLLRSALRTCRSSVPEALRPVLDRLADRADELRMPDVHDHLSAVSGRSSDELAVEGRLRALASLSAALASQDRFLGVVELTAEEARRAIGAASVSISVHDETSGVIRVLVNVGDLGPEEQRFPADETFRLDDFPVVARMMRSGIPHLQRVDDPSSDPAERELLTALGKGSCAAVPLMVGDRLWGELYATTSHDMPAFTARHLELLTGVATVIAPALAHAEVQERTAELALQDPLTGLPNRRALDRVMFGLLGPGAAPGERCSVVVVDLNGLKQVNDDYGHAVGDRVLIGVADALREVVDAVGAGPGAAAARLGGDEFAVVLPGLPLSAARQAVQDLAVRLRSAPPPQVTLSAGVAEGLAGSCDPAVLFASADRAQYAAKRAGEMLRDATELVGGLSGAGTAANRSGRGQPYASGDRRRLDPLSALAGLPDGTSVVDRLQALGEVLGPWLDVNRWVISAASDDSVRTVRTALRRARPHLASRPPEDETYPLDAYPVTAWAVRSGGVFVVDRDDPSADPGEVSVLAELGLTGVLGLGVPAEGGWLLELYADQQSAALRPAADVLAALGRMAGLPLPSR